MTTPRARPLDGLGVVEVAATRAGTFAGAILADLGADVVKVEHPYGSAPEDDRVAFDRGKRSVAVDLAHPRGREVLARLVARSDVLIDEPGCVDLTAAALPAPVTDGRDRPLVHCSITAFGPAPEADGPRASQGAPATEERSGPGSRPSASAAPAPAVHPWCEDLLVQALSGNMDLTGEIGGPPFELGIPLGDLGAGVYAAIGILGAVAGGVGARVEVAKIDVAVALLSYMAVGWFADGEAPTRVGTGHSTIFPYNAFRALDGEVVVAPFTSRFWRNFAAATGRDDLTRDETYGTFARRLRGKDVLLKELEPILQQRPVAEWVEAFERADVPCGPVLTVRDALEHAHTAERGLTPSFTDVDGRQVRTVGSPFRFRYADGTSYAPTARRPPARGEHTGGRP